MTEAAHVALRWSGITLRQGACFAHVWIRADALYAEVADLARRDLTEKVARHAGNADRVTTVQYDPHDLLDAYDWFRRTHDPMLADDYFLNTDTHLIVAYVQAKPRPGTPGAPHDWCEVGHPHDHPHPVYYVHPSLASTATVMSSWCDGWPEPSPRPGPRRGARTHA